MFKIAWLLKATLVVESAVGTLLPHQEADMLAAFDNRWTASVQAQCAALVVGDYPMAARRDSMDKVLGDVLLKVVQLDEPTATAVQAIKGQSWTASGGGLHIGNLTAVFWTDGGALAPWRFTFQTTAADMTTPVEKMAVIKLWSEIREAKMR